jgi:hypothetical protein
LRRVGVALIRWNNVGGYEKTGIELQLLPMLLGFFTYKVAIAGREFVNFLSEASEPLEKDEFGTGGAFKPWHSH